MINFASISSTIHDKYYSQEFQLLGGEKSNFNWVAGLYGGYEAGEEDSSSTILPALLGPDPFINLNRVRNSSLAAFIQGTWEFAPRWHFTAGGRYSHDKRRIDGTSLQGGVCLVPAPGVATTTMGAAKCPGTFQSSYSKPSWLASLDYKITPDILLYAKASEGYRSGGENEGGSIDAVSFASFKAETNIEFEGGIKSSFFNRKLRLNFDGYHDKYSNLQVTTNVVGASGNFTSIVTNAADATIWGLEAEADLILAKGLKVHASAANTHTKYGHFSDAALGDRTHEPFTVPAWTFSLSGRYVYPISLGELALQVDYDHKSTVVLDGTAVQRAQVTQGPVGLLNARLNLHVTVAALDIAVFGKNILNKRYYDQGVSLEFGGANFKDAAPPATFGIEVTKVFGK